MLFIKKSISEIFHHIRENIVFSSKHIKKEVLNKMNLNSPISKNNKHLKKWVPPQLTILIKADSGRCESVLVTCKSTTANSPRGPYNHNNRCIFFCFNTWTCSETTIIS